MPPPADSLSALLRRADPASDPAPTPPAAFAAAVHARIHAADTESSARPPSVSAASGPSRASAFARQLYPLAAALAVLASLAAGGSFAYAAHQRDRADLFADAYIRSIDPILMHADRFASNDSPARVHR